MVGGGKEWCSNAERNWDVQVQKEDVRWTRCDERTEAENGLLLSISSANLFFRCIYVLSFRSMPWWLICAVSSPLLMNPCQITGFFAECNNYALVVTGQREAILRRRVIYCLDKTRAEITDLWAICNNYAKL